MNEKSSSTKKGSVLVVGGGIGGMQASLDLAESGFKVHMVQKESSIGGIMSMLDKTFPTGDCAMCMISPKMVDVGRHLNIDIHSCSEMVALKGDAGDFTATVRKKARYVDPKKCTGCEACVQKCPVTAPSEFNQELAKRTAINRRYAQAVPGAVAIDKQGVSPCRIECPAEVNAHAYVTMTASGRFAEALEIVRRNNPFPAACGRVCTHPCESGCRRKDLDDPVSICYLKRFLTDWEDTHGGFKKPELPAEKLGKIAVIGSGPAGMTCARDLSLKGYQVTVFEKSDIAGGMLAVAIPGYRLPNDVVKKEIDTILAYDVDIKYNQALGRDFTVEDLKKQGFKAVFIAVGTHKAIKMPVEGDPKGIYDCLDFLRKAKMGEKVEVGNKVVVIGGGNVAVDVALSAKRLGGKEVKMVCLEKCDEMPAHKWELDQVIEEGITIDNSWGMNKIRVENGTVKGLDVRRCVSVFDENKRFSPKYDDCELNFFEADTIIFAIGMGVDTSFKQGVEGIELHPNGRIKADPITFTTNVEGVFAGGDGVSGPSTVIQAIASGIQAAESIDRFLKGKDLYADRQKITEREKAIKDLTGMKKSPRKRMPMLTVDERVANFKEVALGFSEEAAIEEASRCMSCAGCCECFACVAECQAKAINHEMESEEFIDLNIGAVILAPGLDRYDPKIRGELGYGRWPNVVTSLQFERILSASGPYQGVVTRPGDKKHPEKIAWIQCVGSRDRHNANPWCSSVCCMYATKEAVIAKEHQNDIEAAIFYMDIRAFGKGFDQYYERAKNEYGVRYVKSQVSRILEDIETKDVAITYVDEDGTLKTETFDMMVLSVGLRPSKTLPKLASVLDVALNKYGFVETDPGRPLVTSREGIYVAGASESPKDIPETVMQASGAACEAGSMIAEARGKDLVVLQLPEEKNVDDEEPRIGVFVCNCGINIGSVVNVPEVQAYAKTLPNVVLSDENLFTCSQDTQDKMKKFIDEYKINRIVVASCSPRTHEPLFRATIREAGLNKYLFEMANIRDQCSWIHMQDKKGATEKAKDLVRMAVTNANYIKPLKEVTINVNHRALVAGGGIAGMTSALKLANQNFEVYLVEKETELGGNLRHIYHTLDGMDVQAFLKDTVEKVTSHPLIHVETGSTIVEHSGFKGNFKTSISAGPDKTRKTIEHGIIIVATGGDEFKPFGKYAYGEDKRVMTQTEFEKGFAEGTLPAFERCVMVQCVGSRDEERPYCSRVCCSVAVKNAIDIKEKDPRTDVVILYRDIRTYGFLEKYYLKARNLGVRFIRFEPENPPVVENKEGALSMACYESSVGENIQFKTDLVVLSSAIIAGDNKDLATFLKVPRTNEGFFFEAHMKLRPVDFASDGMFLCGLAHSPKNIQESMTQAEGAVARALTILSKDKMAVGGVVAVVEGDKCAACLTCVRTCPYSVPVINEKGEAEIDISKCKGCGSCVAECPAKAIDLMHYRDAQLIEKTKALCTSISGA